MEPESEREESVENSENENDESENIEEFDRNLPAAHSYLPGGLTSMRGRTILEPGTEYKIPCWCHDTIVFPGETIPMHCPNLELYRLDVQFILKEKLFGLIFEQNNHPKLIYGVLCRVLEATEPFEDENESRRQISFKALATQRFRLVDDKSWHTLLQRNMFCSSCDVRILPDIIVESPLEDCKLFSALRQNCSEKSLQKLRKMDSMLTPWPYFVYNVFDSQRIINYIREHFKQLSMENLPEDLLALSFWVASNLTIDVKDRMKLFKVDNALLRLYLELPFLTKENINLCCSECLSQICALDEIFAMSNEGINTNYCNHGGYMHNIVTVKNATNVLLQGMPSLEFTWFPGYYWTIAVCFECYSHVGWKFIADKKSLRPQSFWGLTRNSTVPIAR